MQPSVYSVSVSSFKLRRSSPHPFMAVCSQFLFKLSRLNLTSGRFITGLGVGSLSMAVPLYKYVITIPFSCIYSPFTSAELSPPEVRGSLVALQQLAITFGILISFWIDYGTNYIGGTGSGQSEIAWRVPLAMQLVPAIILGIGIIFMPFSPRHVSTPVYDTSQNSWCSGGLSTKVVMKRPSPFLVRLAAFLRTLTSSKSSSCRS